MIRCVLLLLVLAAAAGAFVAFDLGRFLSFDDLLARRAALQQTHPLLGTLLFFAVFVACIALSLPVAAVLSMAAGALYGVLWGTLIASTASALGASLAFVIARRLLRAPLQKRYGQRLAGVNAELARDGAFYLFSLRLMPLIPFAVTNVLFALTTMRLRTFYGVSLIGMLGPKAVFANAGTQLAQIRTPADALSPSLLGALVLLGLLPLAARKLVERLRARRAV